MPKNTRRRKAKVGRPRAPRSLLDRLKAITVGDAAGAVMQAYDAASQALLALNSEVKVQDTLVAKAASTWTGLVTPVSLIAQGSDYFNRDGDSIRARGFELRWLAQSAAATTNFVRTVLFVDRECNGVLPTPGQVLANVGSASSPMSPWNTLTDRLRFNILYDSGPLGVDPAGMLQRSDTVVVPYTGHVLYSGVAGTIAEAAEGSLFVLQISDIAAAGPLMGLYTRLHFVDN